MDKSNFLLRREGKHKTVVLHLSLPAQARHYYTDLGQDVSGPKWTRGLIKTRERSLFPNISNSFYTLLLLTQEAYSNLASGNYGAFGAKPSSKNSFAMKVAASMSLLLGVSIRIFVDRL